MTSRTVQDAIDERRQRADALLWDWAERGFRQATGHAQTSAIHRVMMGIPAGGRAPLLTRPEAAANDAGPVATVDYVIREVLPELQQQIVVARYVERMRRNQDIAERLETSRHVVATAHKLTLDLVYQLVWDRCHVD